jgi:hypothetical protein
MMALTTQTGKQREDRGRTIRIGNEDWERLDTIAKQHGITRHGFIVNIIQKTLADAAIPRTNQSAEILR